MDKLFYEDDLDALKAHVQRMGGNKALGVKLWPDKSPDSAARMMADCCNPSRNERLSPSQLLLVMRLGREAGVHILAEFFMQEAGYSRPLPVDPKDEATLLLQRFEDCMQAAGSIASRMERLRNIGVLKAVA